MQPWTVDFFMLENEDDDNFFELESIKEWIRNIQEEL